MEQLRVAAYARVSSKEQAEKELSIPAQLKAIRKYCQDKNYKLVTEYLDEGKSAKTADRPAFQKMIALAKKQNRHFDAIIVHKFDRFSRSREDHVVYKALLKKHGVNVYSVTEQTDSDTPHGFLLEGMLEVISEFYNMNLANETKKGMFENARLGFHNGGTAPYGYRNEKIIDNKGTTRSIWVLGPEEEVSTVKSIFNMYVYEGLGYKKIARMLNEGGFPGPNRKSWSYTTIWAILHNESYLGRRIWNKQDYNTPGQKWKPREEWIIVDGAHPQIIPFELFDQVKKKAKERNPLPDQTPYTIPPHSPYILRGIFKCHKCSSNMVSGIGGGKRGKKNPYRYYLCGTYRRKSKAVCEYHAFRKETTEEAIISALVKEFTFLLIPGQLEQEINGYIAVINREHTFSLNQLESEISLYQKRLVSITDDIKSAKGKAKSHLTGLLSDIRSQVNELEENKTALLQKIIRPNYSPQLLATVSEQLQSFCRRIRIEPPDVQRRLLSSYINDIRYEEQAGVFRISLSISYSNDVEQIYPLIEKVIFATKI